MTMRFLAWVLAAALLATPLAAAADEDLERARELRERGERMQERGERMQERGEELEERGERMEERAKHHFQMHHDKWVIRNDDLTIWFHHGERSKPMLMVFRTGADGNKTGFKLVLDELFEAKPDTARADDDGDDGDGPRFHRERGHRVNLHPAREWWTDVQNGTSEVTITMSHLFNQGNVTLVFHVPKASGPVKFDVLVQDWKWADVNNTLAMRLKVLERHAEKRDRNGEGEAAFPDGFVRWAKSATVTYPDGRTATIPVEGHVRAHDEGARILLRFNGTGGYSKLDYDPTIGVMGQGSQPVPGPAALLAVAAVGVAALTLRRKR